MSFARTIYPSPNAKVARDEKSARPSVARIAKKIDFLLCNSCFWCASYLNMRGGLGLTECPSCNENKIELMPLSANDVYLFDYNQVTGVILEFSNPQIIRLTN